MTTVSPSRISASFDNRSTCNRTADFIRQLGGAFGVNLLAVFMERRTMLHADAMAATQTSDNPATMQFLGTVARLAHAGGLPDSQLSPAASAFLGQTILAQANITAFRDGFLLVTLVFLIALLPTWVMHRYRRA